MDGAFYRGNASDQSSRFTDKERKLLREMRFSSSLETEVDVKKVNIDVIKPWISQKLTSLLGMEDDVVCEYVFSQLEQKQLNPKIMQINLTGFLNARRAREFMGELWDLFIEAQGAPDGIPVSLVQKKMEELKAPTSRPHDSVAIDLKDTASNWNHRYQSLTYGKYKEPKAEEGEAVEREREPPTKPFREFRRRRSRSPRPNDRPSDRRRERSVERRRSPRRRRSASPPRRRDRERDRERDRDRDHERKRERRAERRDHRDRSPRRDRSSRRKSRTPERRRSSEKRRDRDRKSGRDRSSDRRRSRSSSHERGRSSSSSPERKRSRSRDHERSSRRRRDS